MVIQTRTTKKCKYYDFLLKFYQFFFALMSFLKINKAPGLIEVFSVFWISSSTKSSSICQMYISEKTVQISGKYEECIFKGPEHISFYLYSSLDSDYECWRKLSEHQDLFPMLCAQNTDHQLGGRFDRAGCQVITEC